MATMLIDGFEIDAELVSDHTFDSEVTDHPVEVGADVSDNVRPLPIMVQIEGVVSDTPLGTLASRRSVGVLPSDDALSKLLTIRDAREPIKISTSLRSYDSMIMQALQITKDSTTGRALRFRATFKQVIIVANERVTRRTVVPRSKSSVNRGNKATTPVPSAQYSATANGYPTPKKSPKINRRKPPVRRVRPSVDSGYVPNGRVNIGP